MVNLDELVKPVLSARSAYKILEYAESTKPPKKKVKGKNLIKISKTSSNNKKIIKRDAQRNGTANLVLCEDVHPKKAESLKLLKKKTKGKNVSKISKTTSNNTKFIKKDIQINEIANLVQCEDGPTNAMNNHIQREQNSSADSVNCEPNKLASSLSDQKPLEKKKAEADPDIATKVLKVALKKRKLTAKMSNGKGSKKSKTANISGMVDGDNNSTMEVGCNTTMGEELVKLIATLPAEKLLKRKKPKRPAESASCSKSVKSNSTKVLKVAPKKRKLTAKMSNGKGSKKSKTAKISGMVDGYNNSTKEVGCNTTIETFINRPIMEDGGLEVFQELISPQPIEHFFKFNWEKQHLLVKTTNRRKFQGLLTTSDIDSILRQNDVAFTKNIDVTSYKDGVRETHNLEGRALASVIWGFYNKGCSIRMLNPQTFHKPVWKILSILQEYFTSFCGANVYLTPPGTQGFAPHWDDIEAFILQLEGKKRWRVYKPRKLGEMLPRESSGNFGPDDALGEPLLDAVLEPGDLLYFPRGYIHQAESLEDIHSLHITISTYQKNAWVDLLEKLLPAALEEATAKHVEFRKGLPRGYLNHAGIVYSDQKNEIKREIETQVKLLVEKMMKSAPIDAAIDQMAKGLIHDSLPPALTEREMSCSVFEGAEQWSDVHNSVENAVKLSSVSYIRLLRKGCVRMVVEENSVRLFHTVENSREYHADELKFIEISPEVAPGVEALILAYPGYIPVKELPLSKIVDRLALANGLWEKGIVTTKKPLVPGEVKTPWKTKIKLQ